MDIKKSIKSKIRTIPDFPKKGIMFRDITTLLLDVDGFKEVIDEFVKRYKDTKIDCIVAVESRGFVFGGALAHQLGVGLVLARKPGKLPGEIEKIEYTTEYSTDGLEIHKDAVSKGDEILLVDDLIATGGTPLAACQLIEKLEGKVIECAFLIDLPDVGGRKRLENKGYKVFSLVEFEGE